MKTLIIELGGTAMDRHDFTHQIIEPFDEFFEGTGIHVNGAIMFFNEILKNVWDHGGKKGKLSLVDEGVGARFVVEDYGGGSYDLDKLKAGPSRLGGNGQNFGVGLQIIPGMAESLKIADFQVDCSNGFKYSGLYPYETRR